MAVELHDRFYNWIISKVYRPEYDSLFRALWNAEFVAVMELDNNRLYDGIDLRYRFATENNIPLSLVDIELDYECCSVLEMMVALALRIEETIMSDDDYGDRTSTWFWMMVKSLGLYYCTNENFQDEFVNSTISRFINRDYDSNGNGGLFTVSRPDRDLRYVEIWYQMCMFLDDILLT